MSVETLQKKLQDFQKERENAQIALLNYNGAIAVLQQLLQEEQAEPQLNKADISKLKKQLDSAKPKVLTIPTSAVKAE